MLSALAKRVVDLCGATAALTLGAPVMAGVALLVRHDVGSPVLFRQMRPGLQGEPFEMLKFRTMRNAVDGDGRPRPDAERLTRIGKFLRATSLDELPEFWNVLLGDMSLVGPRPLLMSYLDHYTEDQARRHDVKPGITGWAQVHGRNAMTWDEKFAHDVWYVEHQSLLLDLKILLATVRTVLRRDGISHHGEATMPAFVGSDAAAS